MPRVPMPMFDEEVVKRYHRGKYVLMLGSSWHTNERLEPLRYDTRVDAFALALLNISRQFDDRPAWVPYRHIFENWRECHVMILRDCYGQSQELAEAKTDAWLRTLQDIGQALREFFTDYIDDFPTDYIRRKGTQTCFLIDWKTAIKAHAGIYHGHIRAETQHLFLSYPAWRDEYGTYDSRRQ